MTAAERPFSRRAGPSGLSVLLSMLLSMASGFAACSTQTVVLPSRDFDRPTDMAFACLAIDSTTTPIRFHAQPMGECHPSGFFDLKPGDTFQGREYRTYAFVTNAGRGDLSAINMSFCRGEPGCYPSGAAIVDLDPDSVGYGAAPLGVLPEVIAASQDGCRLVTANRGSCDLTLVDPAALLPVSVAANSNLNESTLTVVPMTSSGRLVVAPGEIAFVPQQTLGITEDLCGPKGTLAAPVGAPATTTHVPWRAVVTFPSCDLIALIELPSGDVLDSYRVSAEAGATRYTFVHTGRDPVCPVTDCRGGPAMPVDAGGSDLGEDDANADDTAGTDGGLDDAGVTDPTDVAPASDEAGVDAGGADAIAVDPGAPAVVVASNLRVGALAIHPEGKRIYFGAMNARFVGTLDITGAGDTLAEPAPEISSVELHAGAGGTTRLRLSVDPYAYSKGHDAADPTRSQYGRFVAGKHDNQPSDPLEFLYVIARDGSVRVVDVGRPRPFECDLQIDPYDPKALATDVDDTIRTGCFEYQAPGGPRRLRFAGAPGLRFGSAPQDIAFANYRTPLREVPAARSEADKQHSLNERMLTGAFAFVMTSAGGVFILNIDPDLRDTWQVRRKDPNLPDDRDDDTVVGGEMEANRGRFLVRDRFPESPKPLTHSLRDSNVVTYSSGLGTQIGPPRLDAAPSPDLADSPRLRAFVTKETRIDARLIPPQDDKASLFSEDAFVYFPNRMTVKAQEWLIGWEGDLTGVRITGDIVGDMAGESFATTITDNGSGFCGAGADGDVLTLIGCEADTSCAPGDVCVRSPDVAASFDGRPIMGMCLAKGNTGDNLLPQCRRMLQTFRRYEIVSSTDASTTVVPRRTENPHPAFRDGEDWVTCKKDDDCPPDSTSPSTKYTCQTVTARLDGSALGPDDLKRRCLQACVTAGEDEECGTGRACVAFPNDKTFCADAAPIAPECGLGQLFSYKISAGNAFVVSGSATGRTEGIRKEPGPNGPRCVVDDLIKDREFVARIPMKLNTCGPESSPAQDEIDPKTFAWKDTFLGRTFPADGIPNPNPCFISGDEKDEKQKQVVSALFQNTELRFVLTNLQKRISATTEIRFSVHGGVAAQSVLPSNDASPGLPSRLLLGPVPQPAQDSAATFPGSDRNPERYSDLPYLFVVDQRQYTPGRLGVRGQILRITPRISDNAPYPGFEGFVAGGRYFPIQ